jgi:hypothetical protein
MRDDRTRNFGERMKEDALKRGLEVIAIFLIVSLCKKLVGYGLDPFTAGVIAGLLGMLIILGVDQPCP